MIALDVSKSMLADDLIKGYSRLEIAKKGIGKTFFNKLLKEIYYKHYKFNLIVCEAPNSRAVKFYTTKAKFTLIGKKIRLFKNLYLLVKKYNNK